MIVAIKTFSNRISDKRVWWNCSEGTETNIHESVKLSISEQNIGHIPKASSKKIIRKEGQR